MTSFKSIFIRLAVSIKGLAFLAILGIFTFRDASARSAVRFFETMIIDSSFGSSLAVASGDLNGDGVQEFIAAGLDNNILAWWDQDNDGIWQRHEIAGNQIEIACILSVELDADGDVDIVTGSASNQGVIWWDNVGRGEFDRVVLNDELTSALSIVAFDPNQDDQTDLAVVDYRRDRLVLLINQGDQFYEMDVLAQDLNGIYEIKLADIDGDGDDDIVAALFDGNGVAWCENLGESQFEIHILSEDIPNCCSLEVLDFEEDGDLDVFTVSYRRRGGILMRNDGNMRFDKIDYDYETWGAWKLLAVDLNQTGRRDLLFSSPSLLVDIWHNQGEGNFSRRQYFDHIGAGWGSVAAIDIEGDGRVELCATEYLPDSPLYLLRQGDWVLHSLDLGRAPDDEDNLARQFLNADIDGDSDLDIVRLTNGYLKCWINDGSANFFQRVAQAWRQGAVSGLIPADIDSREPVDLLTWKKAINQQPGKIEWWRNLGNYQFEPNPVALDWGDPTSIAAADFNQDGRTDIIAVRQNMPAISWFEQQDSGRFVEHEVEPPPHEPFRTVCGMHLNADDRMDIVGLNPRGEVLYVWLNQGPDQQWDAYSLVGNGQTRELFPRDLDDDGYLDIFNPGSVGMNWWRNNGEGNLELVNGPGNPASDWELIDDDDHFQVFQLCANDRIWWIERWSIAQAQFNLREVIYNGQSGSNGFSVGNYSGDEMPEIFGFFGIEGAEVKQTMITYDPAGDFHAPSAFDLLAPEDGTQLPPGEVDFEWEPSVDIDPGDTPDYRFVFAFGNQVRRLDLGRVTSFKMNTDWYDIDTNRFVWWVEAHSYLPDTTVISEQRWLAFPNGVDDTPENIPLEYSLGEVHPNPFNQTSVVRFGLPYDTEISLRIYDISGREIKSLLHSKYRAGYHAISIDAKGLVSGLYLLKLSNSEIKLTTRLVVIK